MYTIQRIGNSLHIKRINHEQTIKKRKLNIDNHDNNFHEEISEKKNTCFHIQRIETYGKFNRKLITSDFELIY